MPMNEMTVMMALKIRSRGCQQRAVVEPTQASGRRRGVPPVQISARERSEYDARERPDEAPMMPK